MFYNIEADANPCSVLPYSNAVPNKPHVPSPQPTSLTHPIDQGFYGAFLMENITLIETIVRRAVAELKVPVTVKIRVFDDEARTLDYVRRLRDAGAYLIGVHGRTRDQKNR